MEIVSQARSVLCVLFFFYLQESLKLVCDLLGFGHGLGSLGIGLGAGLGMVLLACCLFKGIGSNTASVEAARAYTLLGRLELLLEVGLLELDGLVLAAGVVCSTVCHSPRESALTKNDKRDEKQPKILQQVLLVEENDRTARRESAQ